MGKFRIGQRVKKVRGEHNIGRTGIVIGIEQTIEEGILFDISVQGDYDWVNRFGVTRPASAPSRGVSSQWEPIQDRPELSTWDAIRELGIDVHGAVEA
jgi:hypothetical protein